MLARGRMGVVVAAVAVVVLAGCNWAFVQPSVMDQSFGTDGVLQIDVPSGTLQSAITDEGGLLTLETSSGAMLRYLPDGQPDPAWTPPTFLNQVLFFRGLPDGSVTVATTEAGQAVLQRYTATGTRITSATTVLSSGSFRSFGMSPHGNLAVGNRICTVDQGCNAIDVTMFNPAGAELFSLTVPMDQSGSGCSSGILTSYAQALDDGSVYLAQGRCSAVNGTSTSSTVVRKVTAGGAIDMTYGAGESYGVIPTAAVRVVVSATGHVLAMTGGYGLSRLTPEGVPDTTFGTRSGFTYTGGAGISALVPNGTGYTITKSPTGPACAADGFTSVYFVDAAGALASTVVTSAAVGGASVLRYRNGESLVYGVTQAAVVNGSSTSCVAPRTYRYLKLLAPEPS